MVIPPSVSSTPLGTITHAILFPCPFYINYHPSNNFFQIETSPVALKYTCVCLILYHHSALSQIECQKSAFLTKKGKHNVENFKIEFSHYTETTITIP